MSHKCEIRYQNLLRNYFIRGDFEWISTETKKVDTWWWAALRKIFKPNISGKWSYDPSEPSLLPSSSVVNFFNSFWWFNSLEVLQEFHIVRQEMHWKTAIRVYGDKSCFLASINFILFMHLPISKKLLFSDLSPKFWNQGIYSLSYSTVLVTFLTQIIATIFLICVKKFSRYVFQQFQLSVLKHLLNFSRFILVVDTILWI